MICSVDMAYNWIWQNADWRMSCSGQATYGLEDLVCSGGPAVQDGIHEGHGFCVGGVGIEFHSRRDGVDGSCAVLYSGFDVLTKGRVEGW